MGALPRESGTRRVLAVYGTRPEAIKMAPVVRAFHGCRSIEPVVAVTGQHREMLDQVNQLFGIVPQFDLDIISPRQSLQEITTKALAGVAQVITEVSPDLLVVQGDTTTCFAASLAGFYANVPVAHLEAGLRTGNILNPFPEEANRRLTTQITSVHLAPTMTSRNNLLAAGVRAADIVVTGNTVIDALLDVVERQLPINDTRLADIGDRRLVLVTAHRRESWGEPMARTAAAVRALALRYPETVFLLPAHLTPIVRETLLPPLTGLPNVLVTEPLDYSDMAWVLDRAHLVLTDSGGVQEEAPSLGKPVLVLRDTTERPEAVEAGTVKLIGTRTEAVVAAASTLLEDAAAYSEMARAVNPYGDGAAAPRVVAAVEHFFGFGDRLPDFAPAERADTVG